MWIYWVQIDPVKQPIQSNCWPSTFDNNFDYRIIVLKDIQHGTSTRMHCVGNHLVNVSWNDVGVLELDDVVHVWLGSLEPVSLELFLGLFNMFGTE